MAWSVVQHANNSVAGGSATTISVTLTNPVASGNLVVIFCGCFGATNTATTLSASDDKGNTYTQKNPIAFANGYPVASFFAENVTNGPKTFTMNQAAGAGGGYPMIQVTEFAPPGAGSAVTFDQANTASTTTQQASVGATTTANNELVWAAFASSPNFSGTIATDEGTGFAGIDDYGGFWLVEWQTKASTGAVSATANQSAAGNCSCLIMTFSPGVSSAALTAALRFVTAARATPTGKVPLLARGAPRASGRGIVINPLSLVARGVAKAASRLGAGRYSLALRATSGALATGHAKPADAVKMLARSAAKAAGLASATLISNLVSASARVAGMAKGSAGLSGRAGLSARVASAVSARANAAGSTGLLAFHAAAGALATGRAALSGTVPLIGRAASEVSSYASITRAVALVARAAANATARLGAGTYSLPLRGAAGPLAGGRASVVGVAQILARGAFLAAGRVAPTGTGALRSLSAAGASMVQGSAALAGRVGLSAVGAVKAGTRAGIVARANLIAATAAHAAGRAAVRNALAMRATGLVLIAASAKMAGRVGLAAKGATGASGAARASFSAALAATAQVAAAGRAHVSAALALRARATAQAVSSAPLSLFAHFRALSATLSGQTIGRGALSIAVRLVSNPNLLAVAVRRVAAAIGDTRAKAATAKQRAMAATAFSRVKTATAVERSLVAVGRSNTMSQTNPLSPDIDATVEFETVTFDYGLILASGATITSATTSCAVVSGTDATPSQRITGSPSITTSLQTGASNAAVSQLVGGMVAGVTYRLQCVATTSDGQSLSLWTHLTCQAPA
jgi:trimeric autotransporter adhesin